MPTVQISGLVQLINIGSGAACVGIGPTPDNVEVLLVRWEHIEQGNVVPDSPQQGAFKHSMLDALSTSMVNQREVIVERLDTDSYITGLKIVSN